jgi:ABC-type glycerol-3-phosphate transport system substrate-binding protein
MGWAATWLHWLGTTGARPITPDARRITADTPELLAVVELYLDLLKQGILRTVPDGQGRPGPLFETYQLARNDTVFEVQGPYRLPTLEQQGAPPCLTVPVPVHPVRRRLAAANGGWSLVLFKNGPEAARQAAAQAGLWLSGPDAQARFCVRSRNLPVSRAALEAPVFRAAARANPAFGGFADLAPYGWRWPALPSYAAISKVLDDSIAAVLRDEIAPRAGLARAQQAAQALLDEDLRRLPG